MNLNLVIILSLVVYCQADKINPVNFFESGLKFVNSLLEKTKLDEITSYKVEIDNTENKNFIFKTVANQLAKLLETSISIPKIGGEDK